MKALLAPSHAPMLVLCGLLLSAALPAHARPGRVELTSGEAADVEVVAIDPGKQITVRLADNTERVLPWQWIKSVEFAAPPPPPPTPSPAPEAIAPAAVTPLPQAVSTHAAAGHVAAASRPGPPPDPAKLRLLNDEITQLEDAVPSSTAPTIVSVLGLGVGGIALLAALAMELEAQERAFHDPDADSADTMPAFAVGGIGLAVGAAGLVWLLVTNAEARAAREGIYKKKQELKRLEADVAVGPTGAAFTLKVAI